MKIRSLECELDVLQQERENIRVQIDAVEAEADAAAEKLVTMELVTESMISDLGTML